MPKISKLPICYICKNRTLTMFRCQITKNDNVFREYTICNNCRDKLISYNLLSYIMLNPNLGKFVDKLMEYENKGYVIKFIQFDLFESNYKLTNF